MTKNVFILWLHATLKNARAEELQLQYRVAYRKCKKDQFLPIAFGTKQGEHEKGNFPASFFNKHASLEVSRSSARIVGTKS